MAGSFVKLALLCLAIFGGAELLIRGGVSYASLTSLREVEWRVLIGAVGLLIFAALAWYDSRQRSLFYRRSPVGTVLLVLLVAAIITATVTLLAFYFL
jgi:uncharacterized membrane protein YidH (DUF202 family)